MQQADPVCGSALCEKHLIGRRLFVSFMTVAELYKWPFERNFSEAKRQRLVEFLRNYAVLPYDDALAWCWAELVAKTRRDRPLCRRPPASPEQR